jgi:hypothetical protein
MRAYQIDPRPLLKSVKPVRNPAYLKFIRSQLCCATGRNWGVEACHTGPHAHSQKASDLDAIPLIAELHTVGQYALDKIGKGSLRETLGRVHSESHPDHASQSGSGRHCSCSTGEKGDAEGAAVDVSAARGLVFVYVTSRF